MWLHIHKGTLFSNKENEISKFWKEMNGTKNECIKLGNTGSDKRFILFIYTDLETIKRDTREI